MRLTGFILLSLLLLAGGCKKKKDDAAGTATINFHNLSGANMRVLVSAGSTDFSSPIMDFTIPVSGVVTREVPPGRRWIKWVEANYTLEINYTAGETDDIMLGLMASDRRLKKDIRSIVPSEALQQILMLSPAAYRYRSTQFDGLTGKDGFTLGFMAQDVKRIVPEVVKPNDANLLSINYAAMVPLLTAAIQQQQSEIEALKKELRMMKQGTRE